MKISSQAFKDNERMPKKYTCDGENINPPLNISGVPENAKSLVLIMDDPDAPDGTWIHWVVFDIDPKTTRIEEGSMPVDAIEAENSSGEADYEGPCPPSGTHRYYFKLYALDTKINLNAAEEKARIDEEMEEHILDYAETYGVYSREK